MAKVRISISSSFMNDLIASSGVNDKIQLTNEAFSLLKWAIDESKNGRILTSTEPDGENPNIVDLPSLNEAFNEKKKKD